MTITNRNSSRNYRSRRVDGNGGGRDSRDSSSSRDKGAEGDPSQAWGKKEKGFTDAYGNVWVWDRGKNDHWDVQHWSGLHTNVNPDGTINHGEDNFPDETPK